MKLDHMVILLSDLESNIRFYEVLLPKIGFKKDRDYVFGNADGVYLDFRQAEYSEHEYRRFSPGLNHLGFTAPDRETIVRIQSEMAEAGFDVPEIQEFPEASAIFFKDSEGMRVELASYN